VPQTVHDYSYAHDKLDAIVRGALRERAERAIRRYFEEPRPETGRLGYTGRRFERLGDGGERPEVCNTVTPADVLAVSLLGVESGIGRVAISVLEQQRDDIECLLKQIPCAALHDVPQAEIADGSAAWQLWELLRKAGGEYRSVTAYKLLARKRPALLPVYDRVVKGMLGAPRDVWECYWHWFDGDHSRVDETMRLRAAVGGIGDISLLRCLDVALWMIGTDRG
jgi:Family of unknown function (DUF6308)